MAVPSPKLAAMRITVALVVPLTNPAVNAVNSGGEDCLVLPSGRVIVTAGVAGR